MFTTSFKPPELLFGLIVLMLAGGGLMRQAARMNHEQEKRRQEAMRQTLQDQPAALLSMPLGSGR